MPVRPSKPEVVVVTDASAGIGRATVRARAALKRMARGHSPQLWATMHRSGLAAAGAVALGAAGAWALTARRGRR